MKATQRLVEWKKKNHNNDPYQSLFSVLKNASFLTLFNDRLCGENISEHIEFCDFSYKNIQDSEGLDKEATLSRVQGRSPFINSVFIHNEILMCPWQP